MTHIRRIRGVFDVAISRWIRSNVISMVPFTHAAFFRCEKLHDKKGSRAKKSCDKKIVVNLPYVCHGTYSLEIGHPEFYRIELTLYHKMNPANCCIFDTF